MRPMRIRFHPFGDVATASSRLRAWYLADELRGMGHAATVRSGRSPDIEVFQKVRPFSTLADAARAGRIVVYDFDDNYLLANVGTHDSVVAFMNAADLVTVGSTALLEAASAYHDNVYLFENPLDVLPGARPRPPRAWEGRLGWFGNPTNLVALEALELPFGITTITSHGGDIVWDIRTVDGHVQDLDLVLIPVRPTEWTLSKNANRMLKSIALGVPCLVSDVPEHRAVVTRSGLPEWVLVAAPDEWAERIERAREEHEELQERVQEAALWAVAEYGIGPTARRWIERVAPLVRPEDADEPREGAVPALGSGNGTSGADLSSVDVVIWNVNEPERTVATVESLRLDAGYRSVTVVSAHALDPDLVPSGCLVRSGLDDFFDVYEELAAAIGRAGGERILIVEAGVVARPGLFRHLGRPEAPDATELLTLQEATAPLRLLPAPPDSLAGMLERPVVPRALIVPVRDAERAVPDARAACFVLWDFLVRLNEVGARVRTITEPLVLIDRVVAARHPIQSYSVYLRAMRPELADELPGLDDEWERLAHTLTMAVLEEHREIVARHAPAIVAHLLTSQSQLERRLRAAVASGGSRAAAAAAVPSSPAAPLPALVPVENEHPGIIRGPVRVIWRSVRPLVPGALRLRLYRRYRASYERFFPERATR
jgi:hypothetical protein